MILVGVAVCVAIIILWYFAHIARENSRGTYVGNRYWKTIARENKEKAARKLYVANKKIIQLLDCLQKKYTSGRRGAVVRQIINRYDPDAIQESEARDAETSYTLEKSRMFLCVRQKENGRQTNQFVQTNTLVFTTIHELAHMGNSKWGHGPEFWSIFKFLLLVAAEAKIYGPVDYAKSPVHFCGLVIDHSPLFDSKIVALD